MKAREDQPDQVSDATADATAAGNVEPGSDAELVYVCNPKVHGKDVTERPAPGRVTREWLKLHADKGWVECDANGKEL